MTTLSVTSFHYLLSIKALDIKVLQGTFHNTNQLYFTKNHNATADYSFLVLL